MPQDLIGCLKRRRLMALIPLVIVFVNDPPSAERKVDFAVFFIVWWSYGKKICLNKYHGNSEKFIWLFISSLDLLYLRNKCERIAELNPSASCWLLTRCFSIYQQTSADQNTVHVKSGFIGKFSREWLLWMGHASGGNCKVLDEKRTSHDCCSRNFC